MMWIRTAQLSTLLFAMGHTIGMLNTQYRSDAERAAVDGLKAYKFPVMGVDRSHWDFYQGMGWSLSLYLVLAVVLMQWSIPLLKTDPRTARKMLATLAIASAVMAGFSAKWFFLAPLAMSALAAVCLGMAAFRGVSDKASALGRGG